MQLKTSTKISLKFTLFATVILLIFSVVIVALFFWTRYSKQKERLNINIAYEPPALLNIIRDSSFWDMRKPIGRFELTGEEGGKTGEQFKQIFITDAGPNIVAARTLTIPSQEISLGTFTEQNGYYKFWFLAFLSKQHVTIFYKDGEYFVYSIEEDKVRFLDITGFMYAQMELLQLLLLRDLCFILVVYLISLYFVRSSLGNLKKLTLYVQRLDFEHLATPLEIQGHKYDEIKVISEAFNASLEKIHQQILALKDFIANASHELKTPLMMISTEIDIALKKKDYEERLLNVKQHVKRLSNLLETLSLITRLESGTVFEKEEVHLQTAVKRVLNALKSKYPQKKVQVQVEKETTIQAHERLLEIVIKNLIENAHKYAGEGANIILIGDKHSLSVKDTGKGISTKYQKQIFERFRQLEKTEENEHSFGLGLYLVKKIVQLHGRNISIESEIGEGTTFRIER